MGSLRTGLVFTGIPTSLPNEPISLPLSISICCVLWCIFLQWVCTLLVYLFTSGLTNTDVSLGVHVISDHQPSSHHHVPRTHSRIHWWRHCGQRPSLLLVTYILPTTASNHQLTWFWRTRWHSAVGSTVVIPGSLFVITCCWVMCPASVVDWKAWSWTAERGWRLKAYSLQTDIEH